ncbi:MAG: LysR family transcriptional regulator [Lachnospiraceae bacterium]|jgi:DNA-binding transcriptional LysR family regulator|nr:LysR family transcriptional regulator [Lachnospiraceae bacterium]
MQYKGVCHEWKEIEYIIKIAEEKNITKAAEKLYLTPSALAQQLLRTEEELGPRLFVRSKTGCIPTEAGNLYLEAAREILRKKQDTYRKIQDMEGIRQGNLSIGFPPEHGSDMFIHVYPEFHRRYPDIKLRIHEISVRKQQQQIRQGGLDLGFMTLTNDQKTKDSYLTLGTEELLAAVPESCQVGSRNQKPGNGVLDELDLVCLKDQPFAVPYKESTLYDWPESFFRQAGFSPECLFETSRISTILNMIGAGLCCGLLPDYYYKPDAKGIQYYSLPQHPVWELAACYRRNGYLTRPMKDFIELARAYWDGVNNRYKGSL